MQDVLTKKPDAFKIDVANTHNTDENHAIQNIDIAVPAHVQPALDSILDHYSENGKKPQIKLCGGITDVVSDFVRQMEETLPQDLINNGRDVMDFIIDNICNFCREKSVTHMTFNFTFNRKREALA